MWIEPVAYLSERTVCACVKWVSLTSRLSCRVFNPHFGTSELRNSVHSAFGQIRFSDKFGFRTSSAFGKIRLSEKFGLPISYDFGHELFSFTWIKFEIFIISWLRHAFPIKFVIITYTKNFLKYPVSAQRKEIPAKLIVACSLEGRWIGKSAGQRTERQNN